MASPEFVLGSVVADSGLSQFATCDVVHLCSDHPVSYADVLAKSLGNKSGISFGTIQTSIGDERKVSSGPVSGGSVTSNGLATRWAAVDSNGGRLLATGLVASPTALTIGVVWSMQPIIIHVPKSPNSNLVTFLATEIAGGAAGLVASVFHQRHALLPTAFAGAAPVLGTPLLTTAASNVIWLPYEIQNAGQSWSLQAPDAETFRFEHRSGDHWVWDPAQSYRTEMSVEHNFAAQAPLVVTYNFQILAGSPTTSSFTTMGQFHDSGASVPPMYIKFTPGDHMGVNIKGPGGEFVGYSDASPITRGHIYTIRWEVKFSAAGYARMWRDGVQILNYSGAVGVLADAPFYWKMGIYRTTASETMVAYYYNFRISDGVNTYAVDFNQGHT